MLTASLRRGLTRCNPVNGGRFMNQGLNTSRNFLAQQYGSTIVAARNSNLSSNSMSMNLSNQKRNFWFSFMDDRAFFRTPVGRRWTLYLLVVLPACGWVGDFGIPYFIWWKEYKDV